MGTGRMSNSKNKHILVLSQYFYPEQFRINDMCEEWVKRGYQVTVVTGIPNYPEGKFYDGYGFHKKRKETWNGMEIIRLPLIARGKSSIGLLLNYLSFPLFGFFWKCRTKRRADYIFMFETSPMTQCLIGVWLKNKWKKKGYSVPLYAYIQDLWPQNVEVITGIHQPFIINPIRKMVRYIYKNCDKIFATSPSFVEEIIADGAEAEKVYYWPQYAEEFYQPMGNSDVHYENKEFRIMFTGNIGYAQGLDILPKVARRLKGECSVHFDIVGDGRYREKFVETMEEEGVKDMFTLYGRYPATDIPKMLATADAAFFSFMNTELFAKTIPAKLQSYMACGMPIIASARGESVRIIDEAKCGVYCDIGNVEALAGAIKAMSEMERSDLRAMGERSRAYCLQHFEKQKLMNQMESHMC